MDATPNPTEARDIMEPVLVWLSPEESLKDAALKIASAGSIGDSSGAPGLVVVDESVRLVGVVSQHDVLRAMVPDYMTMLDLAEFTWDEMLPEMAVRVAGRRVADVMGDHAVSVREDAPLMECADLVVIHRLESVPVVDAGGRVVGVVHVRDLYRAVVGVLFPQTS